MLPLRKGCPAHGCLVAALGTMSCLQQLLMLHNSSAALAAWIGWPASSVSHADCPAVVLLDCMVSCPGLTPSLQLCGRVTLKMKLLCYMRGPCSFGSTRQVASPVGTSAYPASGGMQLSGNCRRLQAGVETDSKMQAHGDCMLQAPGICLTLPAANRAGLGRQVYMLQHWQMLSHAAHAHKRLQPQAASSSDISPGLDRPVCSAVCLTSLANPLATHQEGWGLYTW